MHNMPQTQPGTLTAQEAFDLAAFINSHPRPDTPHAQFMDAVPFAADRGGLPRMTEQQAIGETVAPIILELRGIKPPWLEGEQEHVPEKDGGEH